MTNIVDADPDSLAIEQDESDQSGRRRANDAILQAVTTG